MNTPPAIDLHQLHLLRLVADQGSLTAAAKQAGISQSALTRQLQTTEARLGFEVFTRTTRKLSTTPAGKILLRETELLTRSLEGALQRVREEVFQQETVIRLGVSNSICSAHLPGLLHAQLRRNPSVKINLSHLPEPALLEAMAAGKLEAAVLCPPRRLPRALEISHRITDEFCLLLPANLPPPTPQTLNEWASHQRWLLPPTNTGSRQCIDNWWAKQNLRLRPTMELDSADLALQLVALGLGVACVPRRAVAAFPRKNQLQVASLPTPLVRELAVITAPESTLSAQVRAFVRNILFS
jgi:DNA-binding transcriptional LysR family regulator